MIPAAEVDPSGKHYYLDVVGPEIEISGEQADPNYPDFPHLHHVQMLSLLEQERQRIFEERTHTADSFNDGHNLILGLREYTKFAVDQFVPVGEKVRITTHLSSRGGPTIWADHELVNFKKERLAAASCR